MSKAGLILTFPVLTGFDLRQTQSNFSKVVGDV